MNAIVGLLLAAVLLAAVVWFAVRTARLGEDGDAPRRRPVWLGPDAVVIAAALRRELGEARQAAGLPPLLDCPATAELASHHAFDMAARGYSTEEDPEGVDLGGRRHRLHPNYVGRLWEFDRLLEPDAPSTEESLLSGLRRTPAWSEAAARAADPAWNALGVGVAVEGGRCALCAVFGAWWATVEPWQPGEAGIGGWRLRGLAAPGIAVGDLAGRLGDAAPTPATPHDDPEAHPREFTLALPHDGPAQGLRATLLHRGEPGLVQTPE